MPIAIGFSEPYIPIASADGQTRRAPLSTLEDDDAHSHVHGTLWIRVNGADLPALGYFGVDDACLGAWAHELAAAARALATSDRAEYVFDEGEQGQPAFVFEREGDHVRISLQPSALAPDVPPPDWPPQACALVDFIAQVRAFLDALESAVGTASPGGARWLRDRTGVRPLLESRG